MSVLDQLGPGFVPTLVSLSAQAGVDPLGAANLMLSESGLQPAVVNSIGAVGINQLLPSNYGVFSPLTLAQYRGLTAAGQLPYAFKFFRSVIASFGRGQKFFNGQQLYFLNFVPAYYIANPPDSYRIPLTAGQYTANRGFDHSGKGYVTVGDLGLSLQAAQRAHPALWTALKSAIGTRETTVAVEKGAGILLFTGAVAALVGAALYLNADELI